MNLFFMIYFFFTILCFFILSLKVCQTACCSDRMFIKQVQAKSTWSTFLKPFTLPLWIAVLGSHI